MKSFRLSAFFLLCVSTLMSFTPQYNPDAVVGTWLNGTKRGHIQIYKKGEHYFGKLVWLREPTDPSTGKPKTDLKNNQSALRSRPLLGMDVMQGFVFDGGKVWEDGHIYNPEDGKEYNCKMTLKNPNTLDVRGYVGISLLGKTQTWTRVN
ncbi:DUF2147 domain-containing protein [Larkinella knui]|uniref:DUF2147 domain-containing protein n=1 Tax=Larkinella knui TaxID=2025310 RepID=A0A3P1CYA0_9BACT|nr:DUF2147 domain-containing protein [Larkinella knui]RRB18219.1 DUF2147 domain-containing protein [Larkinella knui]